MLSFDCFDEIALMVNIHYELIPLHNTIKPSKIQIKGRSVEKLTNIFDDMFCLILDKFYIRKKTKKKCLNH